MSLECGEPLRCDLLHLRLKIKLEESADIWPPLSVAFLWEDACVRHQREAPERLGFARRLLAGLLRGGDEADSETPCDPPNCVLPDLAGGLLKPGHGTPS